MLNSISISSGYYVGTKKQYIYAGPNWEQFQSPQVPSQLAPRYVELGAGPNRVQLEQLA